MNIRFASFALGLITSLLCTAYALPTIHGAEFESLFNGRDLTGWQGLDGLWTVQDGAIVGETIADKPITGNTFLIWQGGDVSDFEFVATVRFKGTNSGVQYRSSMVDEPQLALSGYQLDLHPDKNFYGMLYGEKYDGRGKIATRGQQLEIDPAGVVMTTGNVGNGDTFTDWEWNRIRIVAVGSRLIHQVNGVTTIDVIDHHQTALAKGLLGLQLHKGKPMRVEFKDLQLRRVNAGDGEELLREFTAKRAAANKKKPARAASTISDIDGMRVAEGFAVERVYTVDLEREGSWVALTIDDKGRLIVSDQGDKGLYRITLNELEPTVEKIDVALSGAQGLVWKGGCLYASITGEGLYRVTDSVGNDRLDHAELLSAYFGKGEHGNHALIDTEDSPQLFALSGNHTDLPAKDYIAGSRVRSWQEDLLLPRQWDPRGHARGQLAPGGWVTRFDPAAKTHEVYCIGFRNQYDMALNASGDLFTYDADMEWDLGLPWYRPTRICHVVSGGDFGWRSGSGKWPTYYEDSLPPVVEIGPGSPTGVVSGRGTQFPAKYQQAIYALDWTYGRILAIHLLPDGASYQAEVEDFASAPALPVTDAIVGSDGAIYFTIGGRGAKSELLRIVYTGSESTAAAQPAAITKEAAIRRQLEAFHGRIDPQAIATAWPHLASNDRFLRHAARVAVESQPVTTWASKVFAEANSQAQITAAVALARMGSSEHQAALVNRLLGLDPAALPVSQQLGLLRAYELASERLGKPKDKQRSAIIDDLSPLLSTDDANVRSELLRLFVYLETPIAVAKGMQWVSDEAQHRQVNWSGVEKMNARYGATLEKISENPPPTAAIGYAFTLRNARKGWTPELRRQYFEFLNACGKAMGGASYPAYLTNIRDESLATCSDAERLALKDLTGEDFNPVPDFAIEPPVGPGRQWTVKEALATIDNNKLPAADFERGRSLFHATSCGACHRFSGLGGGVGPDLTSVPNKFDTAYLVEAVIDPSKHISDQYQSSVVLLQSGQLLTGLVVEQDADTVMVYLPDPKVAGQVVKRADIEEQRPSLISQMPSGLFNTLNPSELRDLVTYIMSGGNRGHKLYKGNK